MLLIVHFLILGKTPKDFRAGLGFVILSIPIHYYVAGVTAHTTPLVYIP